VISRGEQIEPDDFPLGRVVVPVGSVRTLADAERQHIEAVLKDTGWNITQAARVLDIDRVTLYNKIRRFGLQRP